MISGWIIGLVLILLCGGVWWLWRFGLAHHRIDWGFSWLNALDGFNRIFCRYYHRCNTVALALPERGGAIVASNHISGLDPLLLIAASARPLRFMIAREEYERFGLRWLFRAAGCIPVDRGQQPGRALRSALRALHDGEVIAIFPHGGIYTADDPAVLKGGIVRLAQKSQSLIYPVHIDGVRGAGQTLPAVLLRSHARLRVFPALSCAAVDHPACLQQLAKLLHKKLWGELDSA